MKKKLLALLITTIFSFSLISCSKTISENDNIDNTPITENSDKENDKVSTPSENNDSSSIDNENEILTESANIYYYDVVNDKIVYLSKTIEIKNKEVATALINELKKSPTQDISPAIDSDITLKSATLDSSSNTIKLDFSSNFVIEQNLGSGPESSTLKAICNTFGNYFNVSKVIITLDGKPYSSGHIIKGEGEAFDVDLNNSTELNK